MKKLTLPGLIICFSMICRAQVHARHEPRHHNIFENDYVRVLDVHFGPGDTTAYHIHNTPSVFYTFTRTVTNSQLMGRVPGRSNRSGTGSPSYDSLGTPRIHRVWNEDTSWFHVMDIELPGGKPKTSQAVLQHSSLKLSFNRYLANGYSVNLNQGEKLELPLSTIGYLLVNRGGADVIYETGKVKQHRIMQSGHFIWIEANHSFSLITQNGPAEFMLLQLK